MKQLSKAKWIRLACFSAGGTLLFYLVPLILMQLPDPAKGNAMVILVMFVNQVFMGDYSQKYMSFYYIINNLTTSESLSEKKRGY